MNHKDKKKLCWNCEGTVSFLEETCPYCGVSVVPAFLEGAEVEFAPPYRLPEDKDPEIPKSPFTFSENKEGIESESTDATIDSDSNVDEFKPVALAVVLLLSGTVFFLFGVAQGLFSHQGTFTLQWDANYWFVYVLSAVVLLGAGWRVLIKLP